MQLKEMEIKLIIPMYLKLNWTDLFTPVLCLKGESEHLV